MQTIQISKDSDPQEKKGTGSFYTSCPLVSTLLLILAGFPLFIATRSLRPCFLRSVSGTPGPKHQEPSAAEATVTAARAPMEAAEAGQIHQGVECGCTWKCLNVASCARLSNP